MSEATAAILTDLGARVTAVVVRPTELPVAWVLEGDLRDRASIERPPKRSKDPSRVTSGAPACPGRRSPGWMSCSWTSWAPAT